MRICQDRNSPTQTYTYIALLCGPRSTATLYATLRLHCSTVRICYNRNSTVASTSCVVLSLVTLTTRHATFVYAVGALYPSLYGLRASLFLQSVGISLYGLRASISLLVASTSLSCLLLYGLLASLYLVYFSTGYGHLSRPLLKLGFSSVVECWALPLFLSTLIVCLRLCTWICVHSISSLHARQ
jgi:hypothetical protein